MNKRRHFSEILFSVLCALFLIWCLLLPFDFWCFMSSNIGIKNKTCLVNIKNFIYTLMGLWDQTEKKTIEAAADTV